MFCKYIFLLFGPPNRKPLTYSTVSIRVFMLFNNVKYICACIDTRNGNNIWTERVR